MNNEFKTVERSATVDRRSTQERNDTILDLIQAEAIIEMPKTKKVSLKKAKSRKFKQKKEEIESSNFMDTIS